MHRLVLSDKFKKQKWTFNVTFSKLCRQCTFQRQHVTNQQACLFCSHLITDWRTFSLTLCSNITVIFLFNWQDKVSYRLHLLFSWNFSLENLLLKSWICPLLKEVSDVYSVGYFIHLKWLLRNLTHFKSHNIVTSTWYKTLFISVYCSKLWIIFKNQK